jgi:tetratricopeptide (TPR) repeat protein
MTRSTIFPLSVACLLWLPCPGFAQAASASAPESYTQLIAQLEARGADGTELGEAYTGLGNALQILGRHVDAAAAFDRALQALRENNGLYELEQLPVVQARLDSSLALASWQEVEAGKQLAHLIALRNPGTSTEVRYQTLRELGLWKLRAAEEELLPNSLEGVRDAAMLYRHELERPGVRASYGSLSLANLYLDLAALEFLLAREKLALPITEYTTGGTRRTTEVLCQTVHTPDGRTREVCRSLEVPNLEYFMGLSDRKYDQIRDHLDAMKASVLEAYDVLLAEVATPNRDEALSLLAEVHRLTDAFNGFVAENSRKSESRIAAPTGSIIRR